MLNKLTLEFLSDLRKNNNRDWFAINKKRYDAARADVEALVGQLLVAINDFDPEVGHPEPKKLIFRIYRDTRFSTNKDPYKLNMGSMLGSEEHKKSWAHADYYLHIEPGHCFLSCGIYMPVGNVLKAVRSAVYEDFNSFSEIVNDTDFKKTFGELVRDEDTLQRVPNGFEKDHPAAEYLKLKHFYVFADVNDKEICSNKFIDQAVKIMKISKPLKDWLNHAIEDVE